MKRAEWTGPARDDLARIDEYYRLRAPDHAERIGRAAIAAGDFLAENPRAGPVLDTMSERKWRVPRTPYVLVYRVVDERVQILRVYHAAEDWRPA